MLTNLCFTSPTSKNPLYHAEVTEQACTPLNYTNNKIFLTSTEHLYRRLTEHKAQKKPLTIQLDVSWKIRELQVFSVLHDLFLCSFHLDYFPYVLVMYQLNPHSSLLMTIKQKKQDQITEGKIKVHKAPKINIQETLIEGNLYRKVKFCSSLKTFSRIQEELRHGFCYLKKIQMHNLYNTNWNYHN